MYNRHTELHLEEILFLFDQQVEELEERRRGEAHDVLVVSVHLSHQHPAETLSARTEREWPALATHPTRVRRATHLHGEPARAVEPLAAVDVRLKQLLGVIRKID